MGRRNVDDYLAGASDDPDPSEHPVGGWLQHDGGSGSTRYKDIIDEETSPNE